MNRRFVITMVLLASFSGSLPAAGNLLFEDEAVPLNPYLQCRYHAVKVYDLPPEMAISLGCARELAELEAWTLSFAARSGLTIEEVESILGKATPY